MADFKKIRGRLPAPPAATEAPANLSAPEVAPIDGRTARATGRTQQLATRVRADFYDELRVYAAQHRLKLVEVLEQAFAALKEKRQPDK
ncbi:MAG: hypothetical protein ACJ8AW_42800 [Rhodopila sp.]